MPDNRKTERSPVEGLYTDVSAPPDYLAGTRSVDPLFGETDVPVTRSYIVQPPQPATTVSPPPPSTARRSPTVTPAVPAASFSPYTPVTTAYAPAGTSSAETSVASTDLPISVPAYASEPAIEDLPDIETPLAYAPASTPAIVPSTIAVPTIKPTTMGASYANTPTYDSSSASAAIQPVTMPSTPAYTAPSAGYDYSSYSSPPAIDYAPASSPATALDASASEAPKDYISSIPNLIRELYDEVQEKMADSPTVGDYLLKTLMAARDSYNKGDYASAEFYVESVDAKLRRSQVSMEMSRSPKVVLLVLWELAILVVSAALIAWTYAGLPVAPELVTLMRVVGWGGIGGVIGAFYNMPWFVQFREYDPAYNMNYVLRPLQGLLVGAVLYLLSQAGILATSAVVPGLSGPESGDGVMGPVFLYLVGALAGFKQEYVFEFLDNILRTIFRVPSLPTELNTPIPPSSFSSTSNYLKS